MPWDLSFIVATSAPRVVDLDGARAGMGALYAGGIHARGRDSDAPGVNADPTGVPVKSVDALGTLAFCLDECVAHDDFNFAHTRMWDGENAFGARTPCRNAASLRHLMCVISPSEPTWYP